MLDERNTVVILVVHTELRGGVVAKLILAPEPKGDDDNMLGLFGDLVRRSDTDTKTRKGLGGTIP